MEVRTGISRERGYRDPLPTGGSVTREDLRGLVEGAALEALPDLIGDLEAAKARAMARLTSPAAARPVMGADLEGNVSVEEAARRLAVSDRWVYSHAKSLPFVRRIGRRVVCSARGVAEWSARQRA